MPPERIAVGNGSCEILLAAAEALLEPGAELVYAWPSFSMYPHLAAMSGARAITVPLDDDGRHDLDAMAREVTAATRLVLVCNPNNPTATALPAGRRSTSSWRALPRHVAVILDEAYVEFYLLQDPDESLDLLGRHPNLVVLRTFSKVYGLCGLRVGLRARARSASGAPSTSCASRSRSTRWRRPRRPRRSRHQDEVARRVERTVDRARARGVRAGTSAASRRTESQANFAWVSLGDRDEKARSSTGLAERGVIVRGGTALGEEGRLRVTLRHARGERPLPRGARRAAREPASAQALRRSRRSLLQVM